MKTYGSGKSAPAKPVNRVIQIGNFYPSVNTDPLYDTYSIPKGLPDSLVFDTLASSVVKVHNSLKSYKAAYVSQGYKTLSDVPADTVEDQSVKVFLFQKAVYSLCYSELLKGSQMLDVRKGQDNMQSYMGKNINRYREFADDAMSSIMEESSITVSLI